MAVTHKVYERAVPRAANAAPLTPGAPPPTINQRGITIHGWDVCVSRGTIADAAHVDAMGDRLGIPLPEMPFPHNALTISHKASGFAYVLDGTRALQAVQGIKEESRLDGLDVRVQEGAVKSTKTIGQKPKSRKIKVSYAEQWGKKRDDLQANSPHTDAVPPSSSSHFGPEVAAAAAASGITPGREYDWTYSTTWPGAVNVKGPPDLFVDADFDPPALSAAANGESNSHPSVASFEPAQDPHVDRIPIEKLGAGPGAEPILFYDDLVLFEDELADNGSSMLTVKVRVMPSSFLVLQRFFLRVDDVLFRCFDVRLFCDFFPTIPTTVPTSRPSAAAAPTGASRNSAVLNSAVLSTSEAISKGLSGLSLGPTRRESQAGRASITSQESSANSPTTTSAQARSAGASKDLRIIRECMGYEASYKEIRECLPAWKPNDLSPLTDPNWVVSTLRSLASKRLGRAVASGAPHPTLSPARVPLVDVGGGVIGQAAQIVGVLDAAEREGEWEGCGERTEVLVLNIATNDAS